MRLLDRVRQCCAEVSRDSRSVRINNEGVSQLARQLLQQQVVAPPPDPERHLLDQGVDTLAFFLILDTVNFGSGWFPHLHKPDGLSGYYTVAGALTRWCRQQGVPSSAQLQRLTLGECQQIFGQPDDGGPRTELMRHFCRSLNDLGLLISQDYQGDWTGIIEEAKGSAENLVELLFALPGYQDASRYRGSYVFFLKRAQIAAADLSLAFGGQSFGRFTDLHRLTLFADNLVPHVLRLEGVLQYDEELLQRIAQGELIPADSREEIEIRACAVTAVEQLVERLQHWGESVTAMDLDGLLWHRGQRPEIKTQPRHRTRTIYY